MAEESGTHAIVLSVSPLRESDLLVRLFTLPHGIVPAVARGAKRSMRRFAGVLEPCALLTTSLSISDTGLSTLREGVRTAHGVGLRSRIDRFVLASYFCELVISLLPEHLPNRRLFRLLWHLIDHLEREEPLHLPSLRCFGEINLLKVTGYLPPLNDPSLTEPVREKLLACISTSRLTAVTFTPEELAILSPFLEREITSHLDRPLRCREFLSIIGGDSVA